MILIWVENNKCNRVSAAATEIDEGSDVLVVTVSLF